MTLFILDLENKILFLNKICLHKTLSNATSTEATTTTKKKLSFTITRPLQKKIILYAFI